MVKELQRTCDFSVEVIKKTDTALVKRIFLPKFPALEIDGQIIFEGCDILFDELEDAIKKK